MLYAYLLAAIVGSVLLVASLVSGAHGGHDVSHGGGHDASGADSGLAFVAQLLSVRFWTYVLAFGGGTGLLLRLLAHTHEPFAAILSTAVGVTTGTLARVAIRRATRIVDPGTVQSQDLVGRTANVVVPFEKGATGKVRVRVKNSDVDVLATTDDGGPLAREEEVLIVEVRDGTAAVTRSPSGSRSS